MLKSLLIVAGTAFVATGVGLLVGGIPAYFKGKELGKDPKVAAELHAKLDAAGIAP